MDLVEFHHLNNILPFSLYLLPFSLEFCNFMVSKGTCLQLKRLLEEWMDGKCLTIAWCWVRSAGGKFDGYSDYNLVAAVMTQNQIMLSEQTAHEILWWEKYFTDESIKKGHWLIDDGWIWSSLKCIGLACQCNTCTRKTHIKPQMLPIQLLLCDDELVDSFNCVCSRSWHKQGQMTAFLQ